MREVAVNGVDMDATVRPLKHDDSQLSFETTKA